MTNTVQELPIEYVAPISIAFLLAWLMYRPAGYLATTLEARLAGYIPQRLRIPEERHRTFNGLAASLISLIAFLTATVFSLRRFFDTTTLV